MKLLKFSTIYIGLVALGFLLPVKGQSFPLQLKQGKINYSQDTKGNRILDFSYCGYKSSEQDIPNLKNVIFVPHTDSDATEIIQRAINHVSTLKADARGYRGAVLLDKGTFNVSKSLWIQASGVVLRGTDKHETILLRHGVDRSALLHIEGINNQALKDSFSLTSTYTPVNQKTLELATTGNLKAGDRLIVFRPSTKEWIESLGCDIFGGAISSLGWKPGDMDIRWDRTVSAVNGKTISRSPTFKPAVVASSRVF